MIFFFKQKTAYEIGTGDWSSDVCSSDLEWDVVWKHAFKNIRVQLITVIALSYANLLEGSVLTEIIFSWPGIGSYITTALLSADMNAVLGGTVVVGLIFILLNIFSDLLYKVFDPRAR